MWKKILIIAGIVLGVIVLFVVGFFAFLTITEYKPDDVQAAEKIICDENGKAAGQSVTICTWNIGYAGLGKESDFFMDGGEMVDPPSQKIVEKNMAGILDHIKNNPADVWLLQEIDLDSARTDGMDQFKKVQEVVSGSAAFAYNYKCKFVPIPVPPMGKIESGIATFTSLKMDEKAERVSLPCPFSWPVRVANIKRCLLVTRMEIEGTDRELVMVNLHLEAYESGEGRIAQTKQLIELMKAEYEAGNYVIAGGDFNQTFPGSLEKYPIKDSEKWTPGVLENSSLPEGWLFAYDTDLPTCRLNDQPYCDDCQLYIIDGFILSPNVQLGSVETQTLGFEFSDHNPVRLSVTLLP